MKKSTPIATIITVPKPDHIAYKMPVSHFLRAVPKKKKHNKEEEKKSTKSKRKEEE